MQSSLKRFFAGVLVVAMLVTMQGFNTLAVTLDTIISAETKINQEKNKGNSYKYYEQYYNESRSLLMKGDEGDGTILTTMPADSKDNSAQEKSADEKANANNNLENEKDNDDATEIQIDIDTDDDFENNYDKVEPEGPLEKKDTEEVVIDTDDDLETKKEETTFGGSSETYPEMKGDFSLYPAYGNKYYNVIGGTKIKFKETNGKRTYYIDVTKNFCNYIISIVEAQVDADDYLIDYNIKERDDVINKIPSDSFRKLFYTNSTINADTGKETYGFAEDVTLIGYDNNGHVIDRLKTNTDPVARAGCGFYVTKDSNNIATVHFVQNAKNYLSAYTATDYTHLQDIPQFKVQFVVSEDNRTVISKDMLVLDDSPAQCHNYFITPKSLEEFKSIIPISLNKISKIYIDTLNGYSAFVLNKNRKADATIVTEYKSDLIDRGYWSCYNGDTTNKFDPVGDNGVHACYFYNSITGKYELHLYTIEGYWVYNESGYKSGGLVTRAAWDLTNIEDEIGVPIEDGEGFRVNWKTEGGTWINEPNKSQKFFTHLFNFPSNDDIKKTGNALRGWRYNDTDQIWSGNKYFWRDTIDGNNITLTAVWEPVEFKGWTMIPKEMLVRKDGYGAPRSHFIQPTKLDDFISILGIKKEQLGNIDYKYDTYEYRNLKGDREIQYYSDLIVEGRWARAWTDYYDQLDPVKACDVRAFLKYNKDTDTYDVTLCRESAGTYYLDDGAYGVYWDLSLINDEINKFKEEQEQKKKEEEEQKEQQGQQGQQEQQESQGTNINEGDYIDIPLSMLKSGATESHERLLITPNKDTWKTQLGLNEYDNIVSLTNGSIDTNGKTKVATIKYRSSEFSGENAKALLRQVYAKAYGLDPNDENDLMYITGSLLKEYNDFTGYKEAKTGDVFIDSEVEAEVWQDGNNKQYVKVEDKGAVLSYAVFSTSLGAFLPNITLCWDLSKIDVSHFIQNDETEEETGDEIEWILNGGKFKDEYKYYETKKHKEGSIFSLPGAETLEAPYRRIFKSWTIDGKEVTEISADTKGKVTVQANWSRLVDNFESFSIGKYQQNGVDDEETTDIEWIILDKVDDKLLLVTKNVIDNQSYDTTGNANFLNSSIKDWLNGEFYNTAFTENQKSNICDTNITETEKCKVFLLSKEKVEDCFANDMSRIARATDYAKEVDNAGENLSVKNANICQYWLMSNENGDKAPYVSFAGDIKEEGISITTKTIGVRPAIWVKANKIEDIVESPLEIITNAIFSQIKTYKDYINEFFGNLFN